MRSDAEHAFFEHVKQWVKRGCEFHRLRGLNKLSPETLAAEASWLREELLRPENCPLEHDKAQTLQARLLRHHGEWLVFVDDPRVPPTNNLAERKLRPLVVLRKITFEAGQGVRVRWDKTGLELGMKESYEEDLASRFGLQRRAGYGNVSGLSVRAEGSAGQPLSSEIITSVCRPCPDRGKPRQGRRHGQDAH